jgi:hypothetical protein
MDMANHSENREVFEMMTAEEDVVHPNCNEKRRWRNGSWEEDTSVQTVAVRRRRNQVKTVAVMLVAPIRGDEGYRS